jgi:hypothetical protein
VVKAGLEAEDHAVILGALLLAAQALAGEYGEGVRERFKQAGDQAGLCGPFLRLNGLYCPFRDAAPLYPVFQPYSVCPPIWKWDGWNKTAVQGACHEQFFSRYISTVCVSI